MIEPGDHVDNYYDEYPHIYHHDNIHGPYLGILGLVDKYSTNSSYFFDQKQYQEWLTQQQQQEDPLKEYFKKVLDIVDNVHDKIDKAKKDFGYEPYFNKIVKDYKSDAYDDLEELLVQFTLDMLGN